MIKKTAHNTSQKVLFPAGYIIEIVGNIASGKTTTSRLIARRTTCEYIDTDIFAKNPFLDLFAQDPKRWTFTNDLYFSYLRSQRIPEVIKALPYTSMVFDANFDMGIYVYTKNCFMEGKLTELEWEFFQKLHKYFINRIPPIAATIFLDVPVETMMTRMHERRRPHELEYSLKYVENLDKRLEEYKKDIIALKSRKVVATYHQLEKQLEFHTKEDKQITHLFQLL